jgi:beta-ureidopropionase / N-carbamoyl-L-amino-acid hydrolase
VVDAHLPVSELRVDGERLWRSLIEMAQIGATPEGGCHRLALTDEDKEGLELFRTWASEAGCSVSQDAVGNLFAERPGSQPGHSAVLVGSHLDTQPSGGKFDGAYGTLAALEILRTLNDHEVDTVAPVVAVSWTNEEGARFPLPCTGSAVFAGKLPLDAALAQRATDGPSFGDELRRLDMAGPETPGRRRVAAYLEAHIEQGPVLESTGHTIGVVSGGQGVRGLALRLTGREAHTGTTPMEHRRDALVGAARIVMAVNSLPARHPEALATVSRIDVEPGSRSVIPGRARLLVDLRHPEAAGLDRLEASVRHLAELAAGARLDVEVERFLSMEPVVFDESCAAAIRNAAERLGEPWLELRSGAGHDAVYIARSIPAAMLFIPCRNGVSHSPDEHAEPEHVRAGCDVLLHAVLERAGVSPRPAPSAA